MPEAVIVSAARTPIGRAYRGAFNQTHGATLAGHVVQHAVARARGVDPAEVEDVVIGTGLPEGATGHNLGRNAALRAGLPISASRARRSTATAHRGCSDWHRRRTVIADGAKVVVAGGCESISMVQNARSTSTGFTEEWLLRTSPTCSCRCCRPPTTSPSTIRSRARRRTNTRCRVSSARQRRKRPARFDAEIVPLPTWKYVEDKDAGPCAKSTSCWARDEGNRADTTLDGLAALKGVLGKDSTITAGNSSQLSDGAAAVVVMDGEACRAAEPEPLGIYRGMVVVGCDPGEMGIGPVFAVPELLRRHGLSIDDIGLWELNEAFAVQRCTAATRWASRRRSSTSTAARSQSAIPTA
jgi:acetyl-CoA C-acetyltransferase